MKVAEGLKSALAMSNVGVGAMVWINIFEPLWHAFKDPIPENKAKEIVVNVHRMLTKPSNAVFDSMVHIGSYLGGQSEKEISAEVVKVRFEISDKILNKTENYCFKPKKNFQNSLWSASKTEQKRLITLGKDVMARIAEKLMKEFKNELPNMNSDQLHTYRNR